MTPGELFKNHISGASVHQWSTGVLIERVRVTLLLRGKRQRGEFSVYIFIASDRHLRYLPLHKGACLGTIAILEVSPSKPGVVDLSGAYPVGLDSTP